VIHRIIWMQRDAKVGWKIAGVYEPVGYVGDRYQVDVKVGLPVES
jgi:hypothetical protein